MTIPTRAAVNQHRQHHHAIHVNFAGAWKCIDPAVYQSTQQSCTQHGTGRTPGQSHDNALRHQVPHQTSRAGAQCQPGGELLTPQGGSHQHQVGDIHPSDQQHERGSDPPLDHLQVGVHVGPPRSLRAVCKRLVP
ncbi:MAG TPA: hypothetical protein VN841_27070 [Bryobacteraceae bacterium]|nr:hypothetical protein [Bryobacteraceae bacterium]